jgi:hypothetical protein
MSAIGAAPTARVGSSAILERLAASRLDADLAKLKSGGDTSAR